MAIEFTQYHRPNGRQSQIRIYMPEEIEEAAQRFIMAGGRYTSELLRDNQTVILVAYFGHPDDDEDIAMVIAQNGPAVIDGVKRLVRQSVDWLEAHNMHNKNDVVLQQLLGLFKL